MTIYKRLHKHSPKIVLLLWFFLWIMTSSVHAAEQIVEGSGPSENAALQDSFRKALENAFGIEVESTTYVVNNMLIHDRTSSRTNGFIKKYTIIEKRKDGDLYIVKTKVDTEQNPDCNPAVNWGSEKKLQINLHKSSIGIIIFDQNSGQQTTDSSTENAIATSLKAAGFPCIVNIPTLPQTENRADAKNASRNNAANNSSWQDLQPFDYIIKGNICYAPIPTTFNTKIPIEAIDATLNININRGDTDTLIQQGQYEESGIDITKKAAAENAKYKVGVQAGNDIAQKLLDYAATTSNNYTIYADHIKKASDLSLVKEYLSYLTETESVAIRSYSNNTAIIDLVFHGDNQELAFYLTQNAAYPATITKILSNNIYLTVQ
jgi:Protein of unknown function, DUF400.